MWGVAVAEIAKIISGFFGYKETATEHQSETNVIKKNKNAVKAIDVAEKIIFLFDAEVVQATEKTQKEYRKLRKQFFKYN